MNSTAWYNAKEDAGQSLISSMKLLSADSEAVRDRFTNYAKMYKDNRLHYWFNTERPKPLMSGIQSFIGGNESQITYNIIRMCVDTLQAKVTLHEPIPETQTIEGLQDIQDAAQDMERFVHGIMYDLELYEVAKRVFRDACLYGTGILKLFDMGNKIGVTQINVVNIRVDNDAVQNGDPYDMGHVDYIDKQALIEMFPDKEKEIQDANVYHKLEETTSGREVVEVWEGFRVKIGNKVGRHVIAIEGTTLLDEEYDDEELPYITIKFSDDVCGWYGVGLGEQLWGIQIALNRAIQDIQDNMEVMSAPYYIKHKTTNLPNQKFLSNKKHRLLEWEGNYEPKIVAPNPISPQHFEYVQDLFNKGFEISGISQLSATAQKQPGLNAAVAIRTHLDVETQRFSVISKRWERLFNKIGQRIIKLAKYIAERNPEGFMTKYSHKNAINVINFANIGLEENQFNIRFSVASALPYSEAGRSERVTEWINSGVITDPDEARELMDIKDLEKNTKLSTSRRRYLQKIIEGILYKGKYVEPLPIMDLEDGIVLAINHYANAKCEGNVSKGRLDMLMRWINEATEIIQPPAPDVPPPELNPGTQVIQPQPQQPVYGGQPLPTVSPTALPQTPIVGI